MLPRTLHVASIYRLGPADAFVRRAAALARLHEPDDDDLPALVDHARILPDGSAATRRALLAIHREFPDLAPVHEQAAYLVRAMAGLRPFAAASDLTGWDLAAETLEHHGFDLLAGSEDGRSLLAGLWRHLDGSDPGQLGWLQSRDAAFHWLADWFRPRIVATGMKADVPH